jgi:hypothetical protein
VLKPGTAISIAPPDYAIVPESPDPARFPSPLEPDLSLPVAAGYPALVRAAGPWGYWRFEVTDGGRIPNEIPGRPALKVNGPIDVAGGRAGFRLSTGDQVLISEGTWSPPRDPGFAIEFWVLSNEVNNEAMASLIPDTPPGKVVLHHALVELRRPQSLWRDHTDVGPEWVAPAGTLRFVYRDPPLDKGPASLLTDRVCVPYRWHHVVAQKTGDRLEVYLDGRLAASGEPPVPPAGPPPDCRLVLGQLKTVSQKEWHQTRKFVGLMDEVAVYERPLSRDEIRTHSAGGR